MGRPALLVCGGALFVASVGLGTLAGLPGRIPLFLTVCGAAFVAYAAAIALLPRALPSSRHLLVFVIGVGVLCRLAMVPARPALSTDIYRYVWEGRVVLEGENPFALAPDADSLAHLRDASGGDINHPHLETIYAPLAQAVFALAAWIAPEPWAQKLLFTLFDLATMLVLVGLLRRRGRDPAWVLVFAWSPLVAFETAHSGHVDAAGVCLLVAGVWLSGAGRQAWTAVALAGAFLVKYTSALLIPFLARRRASAPWLLLAAAVVVLGYLPFAPAGAKLFSSLRLYGAEWSFNGLAYAAVVGVWDHPAGARLLLAAALAAFALWQAWRQADLARYAFLVIGCALLLAPTLYPWYLAWIVPFLCLFPNRAWILLTGLVFASYWVWVGFAESGQWRLPGAVWALEYVPFAALLVYDALRGRSSRGTLGGDAAAGG
jgi:hypothetical protein